MGIKNITRYSQLHQHIFFFSFFFKPDPFQWIGTRDVSAFVVVNMLVDLTSSVIGGLTECLASLCSQAIGARSKLWDTWDFEGRKKP